MAPSVVKSVDDYVASFSTPYVPAIAALEGKVAQKISSLGATYAVHGVHTVKTPKGSFGRVGKKTKALPGRALATPDSLLTSIKTRYAYLLKPSADGTHYVIDLTTLGDIKMRKRYRTLGCTLRVTKDLTSVEVQPTDTTTPTGQLAHLGQVALAVFALLKEAVVKLWSAIAPTFTTAVTSVAQAAIAAVPTVAAEMAAEHPEIAAVAQIVATPNTTQRSLFMFQSGLGSFLEKVDAFLLGAKGLLYHLTGMDYKSMVSWLKTQAGALSHALPTTLDSTLSALPIVRLGVEYYNNFATYVADALKKGQLIQSEVEALTSRAFLPSAWSAVDKLVYILWSLTYYHTLTVSSVQQTFSEVGSVLTLNGQSIFQGIQQVIAALQKLFGFKGTSLVAASNVLATPSLARKFISLNELVQTDATYTGLEALAPSKVSLAPV